MDEGRLGAVRRQQDHHRKSTIVMNDIINFQQNVYTCYLKREQQNTEAKMKAQEVYLKRSIARNSYLLQCLEARKQKIAERAPEKQILGRYGGRPIHAFTREVDACIAWRHPRLRRLRRVERAKEKGLKLGAIMDFDTIPERLEAIFGKGQGKDDVASSKESAISSGRNSKKLPHSLTIRNQSFGAPNILKIQHSVFNKSRQEHYYVSDSRDDDALQSDSSQNRQKLAPHEETEKDTTKSGGDTTDAKRNNTAPVETKTIGLNGIEKETTSLTRKPSLVEDTEIDLRERGERSNDNKKTTSSPPPLVRRPTLILPPIKTTKDMKVHGFDGL